MMQEDNKQYWSLLEISRPNSQELPPASYAIQLYNVANATTRIIENIFKVNHHYVFQLWPCILQHQQQINIDITAIDKNQNQVTHIASANPLVTYTKSGQTYKFYGPAQRKMGGQHEKEQIVFEFKVIEIKTLQNNLETEQLRKMNKQIGSYLRTCKDQLKNYQQFLSFTNDVLRELNQPQPTKGKIEEYRHLKQLEEKQHRYVEIQQQGSQIQRRIHTGRRAKTTNYNELSPKYKAFNFGQPSYQNKPKIETHHTQLYKKLPSKDRQPYISQTRDQSKISIQEPYSLLSKDLYLSQSKSQKRGSRLAITEHKESQEDQENGSISSFLCNKQTPLDRISNRLQTGCHKEANIGQDLALTIKKRRDEYRRNLTQSQSKKQSLQSSIQTDVKVLQYPKNKTINNQQGLQTNSLLKPEPIEKTQIREFTPHIDITSSFDPYLQSDFKANRFSPESRIVNQPQENNKRKKKKGKGSKSRQASVVGSEGDQNQYLPNSSLLPSNDIPLSRKKVVYDISFWSFKATVYKLNSFQGKRCHLSIQGKNYQTDLSASHQNQTCWNDTIVIKGVNQASIIFFALLATKSLSSKPIEEAEAKLTVLELVSNRPTYFRCYLYHNKLAIGFLQFKYQLNRTDVRREATSLPQIANRKEKYKVSQEVTLPSAKKSTPDIDVSSVIGQDQYQSRIRQAKRYYFPRIK